MAETCVEYKVEPLTLTWDNISVHVKSKKTVPCIGSEIPGRTIMDRGKRRRTPL